MDKLIRLLQQRTIECGWAEERKLRWWRIYLTRKGRMYPHYDANAVIISKRFGFIRRLVEKDLIDFKNERIYENPSFTAIKYGALLTKEERGRTAREEEEIIKNGFIDALIMLLAIQENPIWLLVDLIK